MPKTGGSSYVDPPRSYPRLGEQTKVGASVNDQILSSLRGLGDAISDKYERQRQEKKDAESASLHDLQMQGEQQRVGSGALTLANLRGQQTALVDQYGTADQADPVGRAMSFQNQEAQMAAEQEKQQKTAQKEAEMQQKGMDTYLNVLKSLDGMDGLDPATKTAIGKHFLSNNPKFAEVAKVLSYVDGKGVEAARRYNAGELKDPVTGAPLPAGYYKTKGAWTGNAADPVKLLSYEMVEDKPAHGAPTKPFSREYDDGETRVTELYDSQGNLTGTKKAPRYKPAPQGGGHGGKDKPPFGYRFLSNGDLEAIPGGPASPDGQRGGKILPAGQLESIADMKRVKDVLAEARDLLATKKIETGPASGRLQSLGSKVGLASDDFVNLQQKMQTAENIMLKLRSGAAVTESEFVRFKKEFPRTTDTPDVRNRKMGNAIAYASTLMDDKMGIYEEGGYRVPQSVKSPPNPPAKGKNGGYSDLLNKHKR
jgi:hypothetical protein